MSHLTDDYVPEPKTDELLKQFSEQWTEELANYRYVDSIDRNFNHLIQGGSSNG